MFANLLYQDQLVSRLSHDLSTNALPPAILFSGPGMSGKLTAALETARILSCKEDAKWHCPCGSCRQHRALTHPRTILAGTRDLGPEIAASAEVLRRDVSDAPRFLTVRAARKLLRRFDPILWEGEENKISKVRGLMERLSETMDDLLPGSSLPGENELEKILDAMVDDCAALQKILPGVLPISQVRRMTSWAVHSAGNDHKTVIIDSADRMPPGAKNALLKFLEEPPPDTTVILITDRKSLLLPTIVSRVRDYSFRRRLPKEEAVVLKRVFRENEDRYAGLSDYFQAWRSGPSERMRNLASDFIDASSEADLPRDIGEIADSIDLSAFLEAVSVELRRRWREQEGISHVQQARAMEELRNARMRAESLNLPIRLIIRGLHGTLGAFG